MKKKKHASDIEVEQVKLHPLLGLHPGLYLSILYLIIIGIVVFVVGFLPSFFHTGKRVTFTSDVSPSVVYVDGSYVGSTPTTQFLTPGEYTIRYDSYDIASDEFTITVSTPRFLTWLFPRKQIVHQSTFIEDNSTFSSYLQQMLINVKKWSKVTPGEDYHRPNMWDMVAHTSSKLAIDVSEELSLFYNEALLFIQDSEYLKQADTALQLLQKHHLLSKDQQDVLTKKILLIEQLFDKESGLLIGLPIDHTNPSYEKSSLGTITDGWLYSSQGFVIGEQVHLQWPEILSSGKQVRVESFSIASSYVSEYQWAHFMKENPYWDISNKEQLIADGVVDDSYLHGQYPTTTIQSHKPIRNISYYSAVAYTQWLSALTTADVFIPTEAMWEIALASVSEKPYALSTNPSIDNEGLSNLLGGYWEFTSTDFIPLQRLFGDDIVSTSDEIIVKGGSYLNDPKQISRTTVGVLSKSECSESASFRIAWR